MSGASLARPVDGGCSVVRATASMSWFWSPGRARVHAPLGGTSQGVSNLGPTPACPFGHGLSYTTFTYDGLTVRSEEMATDGEVEVSRVVRDTGDRAGAEVVQLYTAAPVARRPHADRLGYTDPDLRRIVEPSRPRCATVTKRLDRGGR